MLEAITHLCPNLKSCCCYDPEENHHWEILLKKLTSHSLRLWEHWLKAISDQIRDMAKKQLIPNLQLGEVLHVLPVCIYVLRAERDIVAQGRNLF